jgi:hypothetical protein
MKCPRCDSELPPEPAKEWKFKKGYYDVKKYPCPNCKKSLFVYYHESKFCFKIPNQDRRNAWNFEKVKKLK